MHFDCGLAKCFCPCRASHEKVRGKHTTLVGRTLLECKEKGYTSRTLPFPFLGQQLGVSFQKGNMKLGWKWDVSLNVNSSSPHHSLTCWTTAGDTGQMCRATFQASWWALLIFIEEQLKGSPLESYHSTLLPNAHKIYWQVSRSSLRHRPSCLWSQPTLAHLHLARFE